MNINNKCVKKAITAVLTFAMAVSVFTAAAISTYAEEEAPVLYLEVSNTLTAQDTFAWDEYDHYNYYDRYTTSLDKHISYIGDIDIPTKSCQKVKSMV